MVKYIMTILVALMSLSACAKPDNQASNNGEATANETMDLVELRARVVNVINPKVTLGEFEPSGVDGLYYASIGGTNGIYVSKDGKHIIDGTVFQLTDDALVNLDEIRASKQRKQLLTELDRDSQIAFSPQEKKAVVHVFTDVDCGYCQKLHSEMAAYNEAGIEIRYLAFPRAGIGSPSYRKIASAWCASDKNQAMTDLKAGKVIPDNVCTENPVAKHYALGQQVGVNGTPAILLEDGRLLPGYRPAQVLAKALGL